MTEPERRSPEAGSGMTEPERRFLEAGSGMGELERRCRWLLRAYPATYRDARGEEILATLLESTPAAQIWPSRRDAAALIIGGLRVRAGQDQWPGIGTSMRQAAALGAALAFVRTAVGGPQFLSWTGILQIDPPGAPLRGWLLALAAVAAAWWVPRRIAVFLVVTGATLLAYVNASQPTAAVLPAAFLILFGVCLPGRLPLPRSWLWLVGWVLLARALEGTFGAGGFVAIPGFAAPHQQTTIGAVLQFAHELTGVALALVIPWSIVAAAAVWAAVDARPAVSMIIYLASGFAASIVDQAASAHFQQWPVLTWEYLLTALPALAIAPVVIWRLRRQAIL